MSKYIFVLIAACLSAAAPAVANDGPDDAVSSARSRRIEVMASFIVRHPGSVPIEELRKMKSPAQMEAAMKTAVFHAEDKYGKQPPVGYVPVLSALVCIELVNGARDEEQLRANQAIYQTADFPLALRRAEQIAQADERKARLEALSEQLRLLEERPKRPASLSAPCLPSSSWHMNGFHSGEDGCNPKPNPSGRLQYGW